MSEHRHWKCKKCGRVDDGNSTKKHPVFPQHVAHQGVNGPVDIGTCSGIMELIQETDKSDN